MSRAQLIFTVISLPVAVIYPPQKRLSGIPMKETATVSAVISAPSIVDPRAINKMGRDLASRFQSANTL